MSRPANSSPGTALLPRKPVRAKAKPAIEHTTTVSAADSAEMMNLFIYQVAMSLEFRMERYAPMVQWLVHHEVGWTVTSPSGRSDVSSAHSSGINHSAANTSMTEPQNALKYRIRRSLPA